MIKKFSSFNENKYITSIGNKTLSQIKEHFPSLMKYYSTEMGNFVFTKKELIEEMNNVAEWIDHSQDPWALMRDHPHTFVLTILD